ncbi:MAG: NAD(P)/FAD-dependent oxidoreductase [Bacteroidia bacterium]|nr:NAD(P)/FAD-dependent oxidoreductase [Bacteroidia bacterium]
MDKRRIAVVGGGAAGFFGALQIIENEPNIEVTIYEAGQRLLNKVRVSGGGRCNVTHQCTDPSLLVDYYPRGNKELRQVFSRFCVEDLVNWFEKKGVRLHTEPDGRMFPATNQSQTIVNFFLDAAGKSGIRVRREFKVVRIGKENGMFQIYSQGGEVENADRVLFTTGGNTTPAHFDVLRNLGVSIVEPVPSLFTFNIPDRGLNSLMGVTVPEAIISLPEPGLEAAGPLLVTHWGLSGPAVLKLSASAARILSACNYRCSVHVRWTDSILLEERIASGAGTQMKNIITGLPSRLWEYLLKRTAIDPLKRAADLSKADKSVLRNVIERDEYMMEGKTTFREEFVTCGGVSLKEVNMKTMESRQVPGLFFAGEVLDIDGFTGGFNFQAAWSTAYVAAMGVISSKSVNLP